MVAEPHNQTPYLQLVPKDYSANLHFRQSVLEMGAADDQVAEDLWILASRDILFWFNTFCWTHDPRLIDQGREPVTPFITYPFQDKIILDLQRAVGREDRCYVKSRDMGLSWICILVLLHFWMFRRDQSFLLVSRNATYVEDPENPKALFSRIDFACQRFPGWLLNRDSFHRKQMALIHRPNRSVVNGESTTGDVARGDRRTCIMLDENAAFETADGFRAKAAVVGSTNSVLYNSTPQGEGNAFAEVAHSTHIKRVDVHWSEHPVKNRGLYSSQDGRLKIADQEYWAAKAGCPADELNVAMAVRNLDYPFVLDGKLRSPWYDLECKRLGLASLVAQELDMDFLGSGSPLFRLDDLRRIEVEMALPPIQVGSLEIEPDECEPRRFTQSDKGSLELWMHLDLYGKPVADRRYVLGADISMGTGASNSCIAVYDRKTNEKVAQFVSPNVSPDELARTFVALARWFEGDDGAPAFGIWERNGPGVFFGRRVLELGFRNVYYAPHNEQAVIHKIGKVPGWYSTVEGKQTLLIEYGRALGAGEIINRSAAAIQECGQWQFSGGRIVHSKAKNSLDESGARENHADRATADAVAWLGMKERKFTAREAPTAIRPGSFAYRRQKRQEERRERELVFTY